MVWTHPVRFVVRVKPAATLLPPTQDLSSGQAELPLRAIKEEQKVCFEGSETMVDAAFDGSVPQKTVFAQGKPLVKAFLSGRSCSVLTYGATGSGKTHSMLGDSALLKKYLQLDQSLAASLASSEAAGLGGSPARKTPRKAVIKLRSKKMSLQPKMSPVSLAMTPGKGAGGEPLAKAPKVDAATARLLEEMSQEKNLGLLPRFVQKIFSRIRKKHLDVTVSCSFMQLQHENVYDLLLLDPASSGNGSILQTLRLKEEKPKGSTSPFKSAAQSLGAEVEGLTHFRVSNEQDCLNLLLQGERNRVTRMRQLNYQGIRCTSLFQLHLQSNTGDRHGALRKAKFNFCDLASSDRVSAQEELDARHLVDLKKLN